MLDIKSSMWLSWWGEADWVIKGVFLTLVTLSLLSWTVIIYKSVIFARLARLEAVISQTLHKQSTSLDRFPQSISMQLSDSLTKSTEGNIEAVRQDGLSRNRLELENQLTLLATIGNTAPFIGLLGTVWGIMHALQNMGAGAGLSIEAVALPVGEALAATAMGLFAAIPAVAGYNLLIRRLRKLSTIIDLNSQAILRAQPERGVK